MNESINLEKICQTIEEPWSPVDVLYLNNQVIRLALFEGEYHWHKHENEDELFYVIKGSITIKRRDQKKIIVKEGEMVMIPKKIEHKPFSKNKSYVLLFEPLNTKSKGD